MKHRVLLTIVLILGLLDAAYLTVVHFIPGALDCPTIGTIVNCETVLTSSFSNVFGVPLAAFGLVWFIGAFIILFYKPHKIVKNIWLIFGLGGIIYSITAQAILGRICIYCSFLDVLIALSVGMLIYFRNHK